MNNLLSEILERKVKEQSMLLKPLYFSETNTKIGYTQLMKKYWKLDSQIKILFKA